MSIEKIYDQIGGMGRFQIVTVVLISGCMFTIGWSMLQMTFAGAIPDFACTSDTSTTTVNQPNGVDTERWNTSVNQCLVNNTDCVHFVYKTSSRTVITEWDLICGRKWTKKVIISIQMVGVLCGAGLAGQLGDLFGRKKVLYSFCVAHALLSILAAFSTSWIMFSCFRFLIGLCIGSIVLVTLPYELEFLPIKWRPLIGVVPSWSVGVALFSSAAYLLNDWAHLHIACGVCSIPFLLGFFVVQESPRWLTVQGRLEEAEVVITKIARTNRKDVPANIYSILEGIREEQVDLNAMTHSYTYIDLFRNATIARRACTFFFVWFTMSLVYYGISFGVASLFGNLYLNIFLMGIMEIPVQTTTFCFNNKIGRRKTTFMFFSLTFLPVLGCALFYYFSTGHVRGVGINVLCQFAKMMVGSAWSSVQVWGTESFPTAVRNLGCGFQSMGARVGGIVAPLIVNLDDRMGQSYVILAGLLLACTLLTITIPETKGKTLKDNLHQGHRQTTRDNISAQLVEKA